MIGLIARHESAGLLRSAQTWLIVAILAAAFGFLFLQQLEAYLQVQDQLALEDHPTGVSGWLSARFIAPLSIVFSLVGPLLAMRSFSDEFRQQSWALWQSAPVGTLSIVIGKYLGVLSVLLVLALLPIAMIASLGLFVTLDHGLLVSSSVGLLLCAAACASTGLFFSSLTRQPFIAAITSLGLLLLLWLLGSVSTTSGLLDSLRTLSPASHVSAFFQGYPGTSDTLWFVLFIVLFLGLTTLRLDALRHLDR